MEVGLTSLDVHLQLESKTVPGFCPPDHMLEPLPVSLGLQLVGVCGGNRELLKIPWRACPKRRI